MSSKTGDFKLFDNKQLVHIASEIVVLIGLTFYFSSKNKKLLGHIEELAQRLEEQEDNIQKLETSLQQMGQKMDTLIQQTNTSFMQLGQSLSQTNSNFNSFTQKFSEKKTKNKTELEDDEKNTYEEVLLPKNKSKNNILEVSPQLQPQLQPQSRQNKQISTQYQHITYPLQEIKEQDTQQKTRVQFNDPPRVSSIQEENDDSEEELDDSDLDEEIRAELDELVEDDSSLKKEK